MSRYPCLAALCASALALAAMPAHAVYKVVGPDGKVTYTDTPPPAGSNAKVQPVAVGSVSGTPNLSSLPFELRQAATKYPVTLYAGKDCRPCDSARQLLQQRGIPFAEKQVGSTQPDNEMLRYATGDTMLPAVTIGQQRLKGLTPNDWHSYLDAAGYPRESKLPSSYRAPSATPIVTPPEAAAAPEAAPAPAEPPPRAASGPNIRF